MCVRLLPCPGPAGCWHRCGGQGSIRTLQPSLPGPDLPCYCSSSETQAAHPPPPRHQQNKRPRPWPDTRALSARSLQSPTHASLDPALPLSRRALGLGQECGACSALGQPQGFPSHRGGKRLAPLSTVPRGGRSFFSTCQLLRTEGNSALLGRGDFPS